MWDLMRGKGSASTKLGKGASELFHSAPCAHFVPEAELVRWTTTGNLFVVQTLATIDIYSTVCHQLILRISDADRHTPHARI